MAPIFSFPLYYFSSCFTPCRLTIVLIVPLLNVPINYCSSSFSSILGHSSSLFQRISKAEMSSFFSCSSVPTGSPGTFCSDFAEVRWTSLSPSLMFVYSSLLHSSLPSFVWFMYSSWYNCRLRAPGRPFIAFDPGMTRESLAYHGCAELFQVYDSICYNCPLNLSCSYLNNDSLKFFARMCIPNSFNTKELGC